MTLAFTRGFTRTTCLVKSQTQLFIPSVSLPTKNYSSDNKSNKSNQQVKSASQKYSSKVVRQNVKGYVFDQYIDRVKNYDKVLEKNFPSAVQVYRVFFDGMKEFYSDMKRFLKITRIANSSPNGIRALNRKELELYMRMPKDMVKVAPTLLVSSLPFVGYAVFPLVYLYPRIFLTSHFWTLQQRSEFKQFYLLNRLNNYKNVFREMQRKLSSLQGDSQHKEFDHLLGLIGSGFHPTMEQILDIKDVFTRPPYRYESLNGKYLKCLSHIHGLPRCLFKRYRLYEHAYIVHTMDIAITREGGVHNMLPDALREACYIRGLNPINMSNDKLIEWLRNWVSISLAIQKEHISLFLHLPILLAYNHPNNWQLIYGKK